MSPFGYGPTLFVVTAVTKSRKKYIGEFSIPDVSPRDLPDYMATHWEELCFKALELDGAPEVPATDIDFSLKTIGDLAKLVYHQEEWAGAPLTVLNKDGEGWVRQDDAGGLEFVRVK